MAAGREGDDDPERHGDDEEHVGAGERSLEAGNQVGTGGARSGRMGVSDVRIAVPSEPPSWCATLTKPDAAPASWGSTSATPPFGHQDDRDSLAHADHEQRQDDIGKVR